MWSPGAPQTAGKQTGDDLSSPVPLGFTESIHSVCVYCCLGPFAATYREKDQMIVAMPARSTPTPSMM